MSEPEAAPIVEHAGRTLDPRTAPPARAGAQVAGRSPGAGVRCLVQLRHAPGRAERDRLRRELGLALTDYLPSLAYVESVPPDRLAAVERDPLVGAVIAYATVPRRAEAARRRPGARLEAVLFADADPPAALDALREHGARDAAVLDDRPHGGTVKIRFSADEPAADAIAGLDDVRWLGEVGSPQLDSVGAASSVDAAAVARAWVAPLWNLGLSGAGQIVGIIDSPIDPAHRFFGDPANPIGPLHRKLTGYRNAEDRPPARHGTFVAGIVAGDDPAQPGAHPDRGVAWAARLSYGNSDDVERSGILAELAAAAAEGARVHTNSWHDEPDPQYDQLSADLDAFTWSHEEHVVIGSAGNRGELMGPPGTAKNVLSVAAARGPAPAPFGDGAAGPANDGRPKPDLMAPGCSIRSAVAGTPAGVGLDREVFGSPAPICASSWAAPAVAGLAALVREYYATGRHPSGGAFEPSGALVRATLLAGCLPDGPDEPYPSRTAGWGGVRAADTLVAGPLLVRDVRHADGLATGESVTFTVRAGAASPLTVTLVWTDPPGPAGGAAPLVNPLELTVTAPGGGAAREGAGRPYPVQRVVVADPDPGAWTITVSAPAVHVGEPGQGYAVVVTGAPAAPRPQ